MLYDTDSYLRGLDNGNRRGHIRNKNRERAKLVLAFLAGVSTGIIILVEFTAYVR